MKLYLDASVILPTMVSETKSGLVERFIRSADQGIAISEFAMAETASALSRLVRMRQMPAEQAQRHLTDLDAWRLADTLDVDIQPSDIRLANIFVRRFELMLRAPDALHAAVCQRLGLTLVTLDRRLAAAARDLGVAVEALVA